MDGFISDETTGRVFPVHAVRMDDNAVRVLLQGGRYIVDEQGLQYRPCELADHGRYFLKEQKKQNEPAAGTAPPPSRARTRSLSFFRRRLVRPCRDTMVRRRLVPRGSCSDRLRYAPFFEMAPVQGGAKRACTVLVDPPGQSGNTWLVADMDDYYGEGAAALRASGVEAVESSGVVAVRAHWADKHTHPSAPITAARLSSPLGSLLSGIGCSSSVSEPTFWIAETSFPRGPSFRPLPPSPVPSSYSAFPCLPLLARTPLPALPDQVSGLHLVSRDESAAVAVVTTKGGARGGQCLTKRVPLCAEAEDTPLVIRHVRRTILCSEVVRSAGVVALGCQGGLMFANCETLEVLRNINLSRQGVTAACEGTHRDTSFFGTRSGAVHGLDFRSSSRGWHLFKAPSLVTSLSSPPGTDYVIARSADTSLLLQDLRMPVCPHFVTSSRSVYRPQSQCLVPPWHDSSYVVFNEDQNLCVHNWKEGRAVCSFALPEEEGDGGQTEQTLGSMAATAFESSSPALWLSLNGNLTAVAGSLW